LHPIGLHEARHTFEPNAVWLELVLMGQDLIAWTQRLLLAETPARRWEPKRLRYRLLHVAARITPTRPPHPPPPPQRLALPARADQRLAATQRAPGYVALAAADPRSAGPTGPPPHASKRPIASTTGISRAAPRRPIARCHNNARQQGS
jgi:hypothetical protein